MKIINCILCNAEMKESEYNHSSLWDDGYCSNECIYEDYIQTERNNRYLTETKEEYNR